MNGKCIIMDEADHPSTTSNKSSIPQSSAVTNLDARSRDNAAAALSSVLARRVIVVDATPVITASEFIVIAFSPVSARRNPAKQSGLAGPAINPVQ